MAYGKNRTAIVLVLFFSTTILFTKLGFAEEPHFVQMHVAAVLLTDDGPAVVLADQQEEILFPIHIGDSEAHAIQLRLEHKRFPRPLTHDLLDSVLKEMGGELVKIQVDGIRGQEVFLGTIFVRKGLHVRPIDARPSDSIALALGADAPIYVSDTILEHAAIHRMDSMPQSSQGDSDRSKPAELNQKPNTTAKRARKTDLPNPKNVTRIRL